MTNKIEQQDFRSEHEGWVQVWGLNRDGIGVNMRDGRDGIGSPC
jgi:hypothetical protein